MKDIKNVTFVSRYDFKEEGTGKVVKGTKIIYQGRNVEEDTKKGIEAIIMNSKDYNAYDIFTIVPAKYELEFDIVPTSKGTKMEFVNAILIKQ